MRTPTGRECPYFHGDYYRGRNVEECRLLKANGQGWSSDLCKTCPVPDIARANSCQHMQLKAVIDRSILSFFQRRVQISAFCQKTKQVVTEPHVGCGECHDLPFKFVIKE